MFVEGFREKALHGVHYRGLDHSRYGELRSAEVGLGRVCLGPVRRAEVWRGKGGEMAPRRESHDDLVPEQASALVIDFSIYPRQSIDGQHVSALAEVLRAGGTLAP